MLTRVLAASALALAALSLSIGAAQADTQPADLGNVQNADRGASAPGPHCHYVLPASDKGPFGLIITGAAHQGHTQTGLPTGIFQATPCP
jgi:Spy/CpxP family protein refolding chaperone